MNKERERTRRYAKKEPEVSAPKIRSIVVILIITVIIAGRFIASDSYSDIYGKFLSKNTDYPSMFKEISEVIKKHTINQPAFEIPVSGKISSEFGKRADPISATPSDHFGIDIAVALNTEISACYSGKVIKAETNNYYGNFVMIDHENGISSLYGHLNKLYVKAGDTIKKGDIIGLSGDSGRTTGPHLHFEIRKDNVPVNPADYISYEN